MPELLLLTECTRAGTHAGRPPGGRRPSGGTGRGRQVGGRLPSAKMTAKVDSGNSPKSGKGLEKVNGPAHQAIAGGKEEASPAIEGKLWNRIKSFWARSTMFFKSTLFW